LTTPRNLPQMDIRGSVVATGFRFAIVVSRFNEEVTSGLLSGARTALLEAGVHDDDVTLVHVPGAFEIPVVALHLAETGRFEAVICLGCLIKGDTKHFEYIAEAVSHGIMHVSVTTGVPIAFGVLTTITEEQAVVRSAPGESNKGREAALAAIEMATLFKRLGNPHAPGGGA
jgi:6,7-dimethyl-8-ribityllumazine synthase